MTSAWIPEGLEAVASRVAAGEVPRVSVKTLLSWFKAESRSHNVVSYINLALRARDLKTVPDFSDAWIEEELRFYPRGAEVPEVAPAHEPETTPAPGPAPVPAPGAVAPVGAAERPVVAPRPAGTVLRIRILPEAHRMPEYVGAGASLTEATTLMMLRDYSQVPVLVNPSRCDVVVTWRSIGRATALGRGGGSAAACGEPAEICDVDADLFDVVEVIAEKGYVLVRGADRRIGGLISAGDLARQLGALSQPFLLVGEIERHVRLLLDTRLGAEELARGKDPRDTDRKIASAADLTVGEYRRLAEMPDVWARLALPLDRAQFVAALEQVRRIRNDVMHFEPGGVKAGDLRALQDFVGLLREVGRGER